MLSFIVPVKSERVSTDWSKFCELYERTLKSICNQTDKNYNVVVVCHEIPKINFSPNNVHYVQVDFEPPIAKTEVARKGINRLRERDKGRKIKVGVDYAKENFNSNYVMTVDSDDYISNRLADFVNKSDANIPGWYTRKGYIHVEGKKFLFATFKFSYLCGSSIVVKPELIDYFLGVDENLYFDHRLTVLNGSIHLTEFPFYGGIYSMANGENHFMSLEKAKNLNDFNQRISFAGIKRFFRKIKNYSVRFITSKIRNEFSFYN